MRDLFNLGTFDVGLPAGQRGCDHAFVLLFGLGEAHFCQCELPLQVFIATTGARGSLWHLISRLRDAFDLLQFDPEVG